MKNRFLSIWGYANEIILSALLIMLACTIWGIADVASFVEKIANDSAALVCAVCLAAALAFFWTLYSKADTEFYRWLDEINAFSVFTNASIYTVIVELLATVMLILVKTYPSPTMNLIGGFLLLLAIINMVTLLKNIADLMKIHTTYTKITKQT